ncbi:hypothetical protein KQX54_000905 [Cotesia glomerata]|uniref:Uncharacterized protein n=1 Tax=Cotesia glomerata TaxID=32391 RepID=A0AAV7IEF4_COTGL|nr:hypothetical protein KQX54_000905 [Cotesia glomerata]
MEDGVAPVSTIEKPRPESEAAGAVSLRPSTEGNQPPATYSRVSDVGLLPVVVVLLLTSSDTGFEGLLRCVGDDACSNDEFNQDSRRIWRSWEFREVAVEIGKVLFSHESRILTPGGGAVSPGGTQPPASPPTGHYSQHSPPLIKVFIILVLFHSFQTKSNLSNLCQVRNVIVLLRLSGHVFLALAFVQKLAKDPKDYKL